MSIKQNISKQKQTQKPISFGVTKYYKIGFIQMLALEDKIKESKNKKLIEWFNKEQLRYTEVRISHGVEFP